MVRPAITPAAAGASKDVPYGRPLGPDSESRDLSAGPVPERHVSLVEHLVRHEARAARNGHHGAVIWLTGLSASGKSSLAMHAEQRLFADGYQVYALDGDNLRRGVNADLGFSVADRHENVRRAAEIARLFADAGIVVLAALISPYRAHRDAARRAAPRFHEVYVKASLATCERRDPRGLYKRARAGAIGDFTGVSSMYEEPEQPDLTVDTETLSLQDGAQLLVDTIKRWVALDVIDPESATHSN